MRHIALAIALIAASGFASSLTAATQYQGGGRLFPDELSKDGLPETIPCKITERPGADKFLLCTWLVIARDIEEWDQQTQRTNRYSNHIGAQCVRGKCNTKTFKAGFYPDDIWAKLSIWYYVSESSDGKPVAYLFGTGPGFEGDAVSYREAGNTLHQFYLDSNMSDDDIVWEMDRHYEGGYTTWKNGMVDTKGKVIDKVKEAYCAPQLDDSCFINDVQVPKAELGKYLPALDSSEVEASGGTCEYPICYDSNYKPVGIRH